MFAVGILAFLFVDVLAHGFEIVEDALNDFKDGDGELRLARRAGPAARRRLRASAAPGSGSLERRLRPRNRAADGGRLERDVAATPGAHP